MVVGVIMRILIKIRKKIFLLNIKKNYKKNDKSNKKLMKIYKIQKKIYLQKNNKIKKILLPCKKKNN